MGEHRVYFGTWDGEVAHRDKLAKKLEQVHTLEALVATWEKAPKADPEYLRYLKRRLQRVQTQWKVMHK